MIPEEKVLEEIKEKLTLLFEKIAELKVSEEERRTFEKEQARYQFLIDDYKRHRDAVRIREERLDNG